MGNGTRAVFLQFHFKDQNRSEWQGTEVDSEEAGILAIHQGEPSGGRSQKGRLYECSDSLPRAISVKLSRTRELGPYCVTQQFSIDNNLKGFTSKVKCMENTCKVHTRVIPEY